MHNTLRIFCKIIFQRLSKVFNHLTALGSLNYVKYDLGADYTKEGFYSLFGEGSTFPQVIVDGQRIGGCIESIKFLQEKKVINV